MDEGKIWNILVDFKYKTSCTNMWLVETWGPLTSGRGLCGLPELLELDTSGRWGVVRK
jgi:hypothetical protein